MFKNIMVPVDLAHADGLRRALSVAAAMARMGDGRVTYVGVTAETPTAIAHTPAEYRSKLEDFARQQGAAANIQTAAHACASHDPGVDLNDTLLAAAKDLAPDLIVMASHLPNLSDRFWPSHGGQIAKRAMASVLVVRPAPATEDQT
ncbi:MAG: universal stress protein [Rhodobacteraceae bacterium]|nr:universal stress protein [Paracoccaceae bacterium]